MWQEELLRKITQRSQNYFEDDIIEHKKELSSKIEGSRILVIGGAGSIGSSTIKSMVEFKPDTLHIVDQNENDLAELVRDLRNSSLSFPIKDFSALPIDFGSSIMRRFLNDSAPYDYVLNFAALKHVRSEKNIHSLLQILQTNIIKASRLLQWLHEKGNSLRYFCVSTDKAANPVNFMGASKRLMERMIFSEELFSEGNISSTSARFANVTFSNGSLLDSFLRRMQKQQPIAAPEKTKRFFITMPESGHICLMATFCAPDRHILIPRINQDFGLIELEQVAITVLEYYGYKPKIYCDEAEAKCNFQADLQEKNYPLLLTPLDTGGEKDFEEFVGDSETTIDIGMKNILSIKYKQDNQGSLKSFINDIIQFIDDPFYPIENERINTMISSLIPEFHHKQSDKNLDQRM